MKHQAVNFVPFKLYDTSVFKQDHPVNVFPELPEYDKYWLRELEKCIDGVWGHDYCKIEDKGGYRWMPGNLYFYMNYGKIEIGEIGKSYIGRPKLRSIDWFICYGIRAAEGFSGFDMDTERCSFRPIKAFESGKKMSVKEQTLLKLYGDNYKKPDGTYKKYVEAREYMYSTYEKPLGRPMYHNEAKNFLLLTSRRIGKSFYVTNAEVGYDAIFNGARSVADYQQKTTKTNTVVGAFEYPKSAELLEKFFKYTHKALQLEHGAYYKLGYEYAGSFYKPMNNRDIVPKGFYENGGVLNNGYDSKIAHVSFNGKASAAVGYGAKKVIIEECGLLHNMKKVHGENDAVQKVDFKFGFTIYIGTGGDIDKIKDIKSAFYDPDSYDILSYNNPFEKGNKRTGLFIPCYYKNSIYTDDNGNYDLETSFQKELEEREAKKGNAKQRHVISFPMIPAEMFRKGDGNIFNADLLEERLHELEIGEWDRLASVGSLQYVDKKNKKCVWKEDVYNHLKPIKRWGDEDDMNKLDGAIVVYEHPKDYRPMSLHTKDPLYVALYDSVAIEGDEEEEGTAGSSLACCIVVKFWEFNDTYLQMNVVAESFYRLEGNMDGMHQRAFMMADYYGCRLFPEINNDSILQYAKRINRYNDLEDKPAFSAQEIAVQKRGYRKGFLIPPNGIPKLEVYLCEYLDQIVDKKETIEGENYVLEGVSIMERLPSMRIIEELINYNRDDNFDGVSCLFLLGLLAQNKKLKPMSDYSKDKERKREDELKAYVEAASQHSEYHPAYNY